jgi:hypothetical protein
VTTADLGAAAAADEPLTDNDEILFRQVPPSWLDMGEPTSQAFFPTKKEAGQLSVARGSKTTFEDAYLHHTKVLGLRSAGTWGVTVGDVGAVSLRAYDQPRDNSPAHAYVDFRSLSNSQAKAKGSLLAARARARGRLHPKQDVPQPE